METIKSLLDFFAKYAYPEVVYLATTFLLIQVLFLIYLFLALFIHRKDRKELERIAVDKGVDLKFEYSWKGVVTEIRHPKAQEKIKKTAVWGKRKRRSSKSKKSG